MRKESGSKNSESFSKEAKKNEKKQFDLMS